MNSNQQNNKKIGPTGSRETLFLFFSFFIYFILLIEFNYVLTFLKDARERGAHADCQSPLPSRPGPVSRSNGAAQPQCAIVRSMRTRTTSHDLDGRSASNGPDQSDTSRIV